MQRKLGQLTGTCFQRCVGMDAFNSLYSVTYEIDEATAPPITTGSRTSSPACSDATRWWAAP